MRYTVAIVAALALFAGGCVGSSAHPARSAHAPTTAAGTAGPEAVSPGRVMGTVKLIGGLCVCPRILPHRSFDVVSGADVIRTVTTDGRGRFSFALPGGTYRLMTEPGSALLITPLELRVQAGVTVRRPLRVLIF